MPDEIMVSICATVYNHAPYLRKALNSIVGQKTDFRYEVIIGEDCSTDDSRSILEEYEKEYPDLFVMIYQPHNKGVAANCKDVFACAKGKYVVAMDMDDFFTSKDKLQLQFDFMENHPDAVAVYHRMVLVDGENRRRKKVVYPQSREGVFDIRDMARWKTPGQVATAMYRNYHKNNDWVDGTAVQKMIDHGPGDMAKAFALAANGNVYIKDWTLSAYRYINDGGSGFSASGGMSFDKYQRYFEQWKEFAVTNADNPWAYKTAESLCFEAVVAMCFAEKSISVGRVLREFAKLKHPIFCMTCLVRHVILKIRNCVMYKLTGVIYI